jgi:hypothetical protein
MQQLNVPEEKKLLIDFDNNDLPEAVRIFQPLVFREGKSVFCVLGPNQEEGIFGAGQTINEALADWESNFKNRILSPDKEDEITTYILDKLNTSRKDVG